MASLIAQLVKNPPAMQEILVRFLGQEDPLEKGQATHSSAQKSSERQGPDWIGKVKIALGFPDSSAGKEFACNAGDPGSIPGPGSSPGEGTVYLLQYSGASLVAQKNYQNCNNNSQLSVLPTDQKMS